MVLSLEFFVSHIQPYLPDFLVRWVVWLYLLTFVRRLRNCDHPHKELRTVNRAKQNEFKNVADKTEAANAQHYEVPTDFFTGHLGPCRKYSSCEWSSDSCSSSITGNGKSKSATMCKSLAEAETRTFDSYLSKMDISSAPAGARVLEIGCGWGSLTLYSAAKFPDVQFVSFSNSRTQIAYINEQAAARGLKNVTAVRLDINDFCAGKNIPKDISSKKFDRAVSIECLEHSKDYNAIFRAVSSVLKDDGRVFIQILCHREYTYFMNSDDWMGRNFFTGGTIPSTKLFLFFNEHLGVDKSWYISGKEYQRTLDAWLHQMEANKTALVNVFDQAVTPGGQKAYPDGGAVEYEKWRMFYIMSSESFGFGRGNEWMVAYYSMSKRQATAALK